MISRWSVLGDIAVYYLIFSGLFVASLYAVAWLSDVRARNRRRRADVRWVRRNGSDLERTLVELDRLRRATQRRV